MVAPHAAGRFSNHAKNRLYSLQTLGHLTATVAPWKEPNSLRPLYAG
jgi:hypothetical protein